MTDAVDPVNQPGGSDEDEHLQPIVTRRDFLAGAGLGVVGTAVVAGGVTLATRSAAPGVPQPGVQTGGGPGIAVAPAPGVAKPATGAQADAAGQAATRAAAAQALPASMRRVTLNLDGREHTVIVDVRESLWETMVYRLGQSSSNLGCDRAQCGACAVVVDGRAMNGCTLMTARLGRGQKIVTVDGIRSGPGVAGLHPVQRAYWREGGYQCGICTRGFIMSTYALLQVNKKPTKEEINEALSGNICRCSEYPLIFESVNAAAAEMRGELKPGVLTGGGENAGELEDPSAAH